MTAFSRRVAAFVTLAAFAIVLVGCGDSEADQRKAFIKFLQDINHRAGVHFLKPTDEDRVSFGDYYHHYEIITVHNTSMGKTSGAFNARASHITSGRNAQSIEDVVNRRDAMASLKDEVGKLQVEIDQRLAEVKNQRAALKQPDDLKAVYDVTFDRLVIKPTQAVKNQMKALEDGLAASVQVADYVRSHPGKVTVKGQQILATDPKTLSELKVLMDARTATARHLEEAGRQLQRVLQGS